MTSLGENYDKDLSTGATDIFAIQSELAHEIAHSLRAAISPDEKKQLEDRPTDNVAAYDLFLKERAIKAAGGTDRDTRETYLQTAVRLDPNFALAWAALGHFYVTEYGTNGSAETLAKAEAAIARAGVIAPNHAQVLITRGYYLMQVEDQHAKAEELFLQAGRLQPNNLDVHGHLGNLCVEQGRYSEAIGHYRRRIDLEPGDRRYLQRLVGLLDAGRRYDDALIWQRKMVQADPGSLTEAFLLAWIPFRATGSATEARAFLAGHPTGVRDNELLRIKRIVATFTGDPAEYARVGRVAAPATRPVTIAGRLTLIPGLVLKGAR